MIPWGKVLLSLTGAGRALSSIALAGLLSGGSVLAQQQERHDWLIVPGVRVGPITASTTEASLRETFGERAVITERVHGGDFDTRDRVTLAQRDDPSRAIAITWSGQGGIEHPETVLFCFGVNAERGTWRTSSGIGCGTTLRDLEALNGRPFTLSGYDGDLSGTVMSWRRGKLEGELGRKGALEISIAPKDRRWRDRLTETERNKLKGDTLQSDDPTTQRLNPIVYRMVFTFAGAKK